MGQLKNKVAIVTGAGRGIGRAIAKCFAAEGAKVIVLSKTEKNIQRTVDEITDAGGTALGVQCDITVPEQITASIKRVIDAYGTVDILVNNAMDISTNMGSVLDTNIDHIIDQTKGGAIAHLLFMRACYPYMKGRAGRVINFASSVGVIGQQGFVPYAVAKEGVRALTRVAAREWGADDITVNCICPIAITDAFDTATTETDWDPADMFPIPRMGSVDKDIAPVALFLASAASGYMTGYSFMADGGFMMDAAR